MQQQSKNAECGFILSRKKILLGIRIVQQRVGHSVESIKHNNFVYFTFKFLNRNQKKLSLITIFRFLSF